MKVKEGDQFPNFELTDHLGDQFTLYEQHDTKYRVLYFYPKDETPGVQDKLVISEIIAMIQRI